jgi:hypothetical protein
MLHHGAFGQERVGQRTTRNKANLSFWTAREMPTNGCDGPRLSTPLLEIGIIIVGTFLGKNDNEQHVKTKTETIAHCEKKAN